MRKHRWSDVSLCFPLCVFSFFPTNQCDFPTTLTSNSFLVIFDHAKNTFLSLTANSPLPFRLQCHLLRKSVTSPSAIHVICSTPIIDHFLSSIHILYLVHLESTAHKRRCCLTWFFSLTSAVFLPEFSFCAFVISSLCNSSNALSFAL